MTLDRVTGAMLGHSLGDALGAPYEGGVVERLAWKLLGRTRAGEMRFTDDTQMSLDLAESLLSNGGVEQDSLAQAFARSYRWSRGYGPGAAKVLKRIRAGWDWRAASKSVYANGSFGNGAAMRAHVVGIFFHSDPQERATAAIQTAEITHAHPIAIDGARLVAEATACAL